MPNGDIHVAIVFRGLNCRVAGVLCNTARYGSVIVSPYDLEDARGLFKAAIHARTRLYVSFPVSKEAQDKDFVIEFDKAKVMMPGTNVTVVAFSRTVGEALMPLLKRERTPNDQPHCFHQKGWGQSGIGFEIVGIIMEMEAFDYLDNNPLSA
ncbi:hypothetical protein F443_19468 [Phytophthora nicotianae P1569]|uniref:Pyruvate dehydrogenase E1 component subunit beta n=1 Tax=Phytophthora nicotianae P1569 TaxID=1317065 RepID=V9E6L7_PHYNI|nr:hypothetical protein F443_19468 [Phytophthora nicotianae P1569]